MTPLLLFLLLQAGDAATTVVFLDHGVREANPLVAAFIDVFGEPVAAVVAIKLAGSVLAAYAWKTGRIRLLRRINVLFAVCVAWNLLAIWRGPVIV